MPSTTLVATFFTFQIFGGQFGMALFLGTVALSKKVHKHPLLVSFLVSWILYSTSFCLLLYLGHQFDPQKPLPLCVAQLAMIYGSTISTAFAAFALIFNIWMSAGRLIHSDLTTDSTTGPEAGLRRGEEDKESRWITRLLVIAPHITFVLVTLYLVSEASGDPSRIQIGQESLYCGIESDTAQIVPYVVVVIILLCITLEVIVAIKLLKFWKAVVEAKLTNDAFIRIFIRVAVFTLYCVLSLVAAVKFWTEEGDGLTFPYIIQALLPTAAFIIFGTQMDLLTAWGVARERAIGTKATGCPGRAHSPTDSLKRSGESSADGCL